MILSQKLSTIVCLINQSFENLAASAPCLATTSLKPIPFDECELFPNVAKVLLKYFYVDDVLAGASFILEGKDLISQ